MSDASTDRAIRALRGVALVTLVLCVLGLPLAFLPSVDIYRDASDCFARAFAAHGSGHCTTDYVLAETKHPGILVIGCLVGIALLAFGLRRRPSGLAAVIGSLPALALAVIGAACAVDFEIFTFDHKVVRWSAELLALLFGLVGLIAIVVFVTTLGVGIVRAINRRRADPDPVPKARLVQRG